MSTSSSPIEHLVFSIELFMAKSFMDFDIKSNLNSGSEDS